MHKPTLRGEMLTLRPLRADDAEAAWLLATDPENRRMSAATGEVARSDVEDWCARASGFTDRFDWAITAPDGEEMLGELVLADLDLRTRSAGVQLGLRQGHRGRGYAREAMILALRFAFTPRPEGLGLHRVGLDLLSINARAFALYESLGFVTEGRLRDSHLDGSWYCDTILMGMLEEDYVQASAAWR